MDDTMTDLAMLDALERSWSEGEEPTLGRAFVLWLARWRAGLRDRETTVRLLFLAWYLVIEPEQHTGARTALGAYDVLREVVAAIERDDANDAETLYGLAYVYELWSWLLGLDDDTGRARSRECVARARALAPQGFGPEHFEGRGEYGRYFGPMARDGDWFR